MAKATAQESNPNIFQRVVTFYQEVRVEMDKVTWPSNEDLRLSTIVTMYMLVIMAAIIFGLDNIIQTIVVTLLSFV